MASEDYYRPYRDDLLNYDPAQALAITREGAAQRQDFEGRAGQDRVLAEERKWDRIGEIPTKLLEGYERGTKTARERGRDEREEKSFAEEQRLRQIQTEDVTKRMEDAARQRAYENEIVSGGKSRYQTMKDAELEGLINAPKMERERLDIAKAQAKAQSDAANAQLGISREGLNLTKRQAKIEEAKTLFGPALISSDPGTAMAAQRQLVNNGLSSEDVQAVTAAARAQALQTQKANEIATRATFGADIERARGFNEVDMALHDLDTAIEQYKAGDAFDLTGVPTETKAAKDNAMAAIAKIDPQYAARLSSEQYISADDLELARNQLAQQVKSRVDTARKTIPDAAGALPDVQRTMGAIDTTLAPRSQTPGATNQLTTYGGPAAPTGNKNVYNPITGQPEPQMQTVGTQPLPFDWGKLIRQRSPAPGARK